MAIIRKKEMKSMTSDELKKRLDELKLELIKQRGQLAVGGAVKSPGRVKYIRRTIASILTILNERKKKSAGVKNG